MARKARIAAALAAAAFIYSAATLPAERFAFSYARGDRYRILTNVDEWIYVNRVLQSRVEIVNRIAMQVRDVKDGRGFLSGNFQTSERLAGSSSAFLTRIDYDSEFWRDALGRFKIDDRFFMPVVRDVPVFPDRDLAPGDTWSAPGEERHDFRRSYGIQEPYRIPFEARYEYLGRRDYQGRSLPAIRASYTIFYEPPAPARYGSAYPRRIMGHSDQTIYWDEKAGQPLAYAEEFKIIIEQSDGVTVEFTGRSEGRVIEAEVMDRDAVEKQVKEEIERLGIQDASVRKDELGVVISLEDVKFLAESAVLLASEKEKLRKIGRILEGLPDRDIRITGHTALAGTEAGRRALSEERARAVADFLISLGVREAERMTVIGVGASQPVADNSTPEGMRRNRRVEITILEN